MSLVEGTDRECSAADAGVAAGTELAEGGGMFYVCSLSWDLRKACSSISRAKIPEVVSRRCLQVQGLTRCWNRHATRLGNPSRHVSQERGLHQGCAVSPALLVFLLGGDIG